ncbi:APC family permease [Thermogemmatispora sp.]|uniref:APC family permease n=1 Tax=Thermogemmatispora sp. TaxID=1968838 RepID=UPI0035E44437
MSSVSKGTAGTTTHFVRNATGLVRELSPFDAFNLVFSAVLIPVGITQVFSFAPTFWPGANVLVSFLLSLPLVFCFGMVYLYFTVAMPRSGGDYVWVSRVLGPGVGFLTNLTLTFVFTTWISFNFTTMLTLLGPSLGFVAGWNWAPDQLTQFLIATALTLIFAALMVLGARRVARYMLVMFALVWLGMLVWLVGLAITDHSAFVANFNARSGTTLSQVVSLAARAGFAPGSGLDWAGTIFAMIYAFQVFTGFQWTGYFAGEIKNVRRTATFSILGALFLSALLYILGSALIYRTYGTEFAPLVFLGFNASPTPLPFAPYLPALVKFLSLPSFLQIFVAACFVLSVLWWTPTGFMIATRNLFAWSFDRLAPAGVAEVSERLHTPVIATVVIALWVEVLNYLNIYQGLSALLINVIAVMALAFIAVALAAILMPFTRRQLFEEAPALVRARLLGIPVLTLVGIVMLLSWAFVLYVTFSTTAFGKVSPLSMAEAFAVPVLGLVYYLIVRFVRQRQGIQLSAAFREIPPE